MKAVQCALHAMPLIHSVPAEQQLGWAQDIRRRGASWSAMQSRHDHSLPVTHRVCCCALSCALRVNLDIVAYTVHQYRPHPGDRAAWCLRALIDRVRPGKLVICAAYQSTHEVRHRSGQAVFVVCHVHVVCIRHAHGGLGSSTMQTVTLFFIQGVHAAATAVADSVAGGMRGA